MKWNKLVNLRNNKRKWTYFLANIDHELYSQLRDLFLPHDLANQTLETALKVHFEAKSNIIVERYKFHSLRQSEIQLFQDYVLLLKRQAAKCEFGVLLDDMIHDQIVTGISRDVILRRLLTNPKLTLEKAIELLTVEELHL